MTQSEYEVSRDGAHRHAGLPCKDISHVDRGALDPTRESSHGAESALAIILFLLPLTSLAQAQGPLRVSSSSPLTVPGHSTNPKMATPQSHTFAAEVMQADAPACSHPSSHSSAQPVSTL
ncbi:hypothetical protein GGP41_004695 [Bipolaris sorokiniana]|uniref:Uncharacterized protein n=1 Tax=Cochliobolus sativus TaxID=45130 RepID=A0A8H6DUB3_COCSA|nr:hypothetical protein GGP41_004695 [Bipolaris sorokiniana]